MADENSAQPSSPATPVTHPKPTEKDAFFFMNVIASMKNKPEVDWTKVAGLSGLKNASSASVRFGQIKKKLGWTEEAGMATNNTPTKSRAGRKPADPNKVVKKRTPKKAKVAPDVAEAAFAEAMADNGTHEDVEDDDLDEF